MTGNKSKLRGRRRRYGNKTAFDFHPKRTADDLSAGEHLDVYEDDRPALLVAMDYDVPISDVRKIWRCRHSRPEIASCEPRNPEPM